MRFSQPGAQARWDAFAARLDAGLDGLARADRDELRAEIEGHAADAFAEADPALDEEARLAHVLDRLGDPVEFLRPLRTDRLVDAGTRAHPLLLARGLAGMMAEGGKAALVALTFLVLYLCLFVFAAMAVLKPVFPDRLGLFRSPEGQLDFGFVSDTAGSTDLIGYWAMPLGLALAALTWWLLGLLLRRARR